MVFLASALRESASASDSVRVSAQKAVWNAVNNRDKEKDETFPTVVRAMSGMATTCCIVID